MHIEYIIEIRVAQTDRLNNKYVSRLFINNVTEYAFSIGQGYILRLCVPPRRNSQSEGYGADILIVKEIRSPFQLPPTLAKVRGSAMLKCSLLQRKNRRLATLHTGPLGKDLKLSKAISRLSEVGIELRSPQKAIKVLTRSRIDHLCSIINNCPHSIHGFKYTERGS